MKFLRNIFIALSAIVLVTLGIDAADNRDDFSKSIARKAFGISDAPCPDDMVLVLSENGNFCIDRYEASPGEECVIADPKSGSETQININEKDCRPISMKRAVPWRFVSQTQASILCAKAGKRLPTDEEWYLSALGTPDASSGWGSDDCQVSENWSSQPGETGSGVNCVSAAGAYDMVGNVWEWVKGEVRDGMLAGVKLPPQGYVSAVDSRGLPIETAETPDPMHNNDYAWFKGSGVRGVARGGYWNNESQAGNFSLYMVSMPDFTGSAVGFRCVK